MSISIVGASVIIDYILPVEKLPTPGEVVRIIKINGLGKPYWGGCAPNIAASLARLGIPSSLVYPVGDDFPESDCENYWRSLGIDLSNLCLQPGRPSGVAYLFFQPGAETMCFSALGASAEAQPQVNTCLEELVVLTPVVGDFTSHYLDRSLSERHRVAVSGVVSPQIVDSLNGIQLFIHNSREASALCRLAHIPDISHLAHRYPNCLFYVTCGDKGSMVFQDRTQIAIPAIQPGRYVDPTGAGDAYAAGVIMAWLKGYDPETAGYIGATCASFVLEAFGAQTNLPSMQEVVKRLSVQTPEIGRRIHEKDLA